MDARLKTRLAAMLVMTLCVIEISPSPALAAGFEKAIMFSGKYAGVGNAAVSSVDTAEALYFNPGALATNDAIRATLDFSPTWSKFTTPLAGPNTQVESNTSFSAIGGAFASLSLMPKVFSVGIGWYVSGGEKVEYPVALPVDTDLRITEFALGAGLELGSGFRLGASWRVPHVSVDFGPLTGLSTTKWDGFRIGLQYGQEKCPFGAGIDYRSQVSFTATDTLPVGLSAVFPQQLQFGVHYDWTPDWRTLLEYDWAEYTKVNETLHLGWQPLSNLRFGIQTKTLKPVVLRVGYVYTSEVTPKSQALPNVATPGSGNSVTAGVGTSVASLLDVDLALEYSWASGTVTTEGSIPGDYSSKAYAAHLGVSVQL